MVPFRIASFAVERDKENKKFKMVPMEEKHQCGCMYKKRSEEFVTMEKSSVRFSSSVYGNSDENYLKTRASSMNRSSKDFITLRNETRSRKKHAADALTFQLIHYMAKRNAYFDFVKKQEEEQINSRIRYAKELRDKCDHCNKAI